jgi:hypothetical protein
MRDELRERVREALEGPVEQAEKLLSELSSANSETKLSILISGWGRALAAALEELAIAIDDLRQTAAQPTAEPSASQAAESELAQQPEPEDQPERSDLPDAADLSEARLLDEAKKSREATAELREEAQHARRDLEQ